MATAYAAPAAIQAPAWCSSRAEASSPASTPATVAAKTRNRSGGPPYSQGHRAVDGRQQHVTDVGPLQRQRAAPGARAQADGDDHGGQHAQPVGPVHLHVVQGLGAELAVADHRCQAVERRRPSRAVMYTL